VTTQLLPLTPDELLTTTRSVRRRLDLERLVERTLIEECLEIAMQAPTGGNIQNWHWIVVTDPERRAEIGDLYRRGVEVYKELPIAAHNLPVEGEERKALQRRIMDSALYLGEHYHEVPAMVVPCVAPRVAGVVLPADGTTEQEMADFVSVSLYGSVLQAVWSLQLAARARGLASCWTTIQTFYERELAGILGIPYEEVQQIGLLCLAHSRGTEYRPAPREPLEAHAHWDGW
jgi:nitroreductase